MIKNNIITLNIALSTIPFAYQIMEGPYIFNGTSSNSQPIYHSSFYHDRSTKYVFVGPSPDKNDSSIEDLNKAGIAYSPFLVKSSLKSSEHVKQQANTFVDGINLSSYQYLLTQKQRWINDRHFSSIEKFFTTPSGVTIRNENDTPTLIKENKAINFQKTLTQYFDNNDNHNLKIVDAINFSKLNDSKEEEHPTEALDLAKAAANIRTNSLFLDLLSKSEIKNIYTIVEDETENKVILFGRAEYITGNKKNFYWITEIKGSLSDLCK